MNLSRLALLMGLGVAANAAVISYEINFTGSGLLPTSGSFTYDTTLNQFAAFVVTWDNLTFDFTSAANTAPLLTGGGACITDTAPPATLSFLTMATVCGAGQSGPSWSGDGSGHGFTFAEASAGNTSVIELFTSAPGVPTDFGVSSGSFTASQAPEPSTLLLTAIAAGAMLLAGKRRGLIGLIGADRDKLNSHTH